MFLKYLIILATFLNFGALANAETKGIYERLADGYRDQAANFSDETLVNKSNSPNWSWLWITPYHIHGELVKRANKSQTQAIKLTSLLLTSFEESRDMNGSHVQSSFLQVFSAASQDPEKIPLNFIKTAANKIESLSRLLRDAEDQATLKSAQEIFTSRLVGQVGTHFLKVKQFEQTYQFYSFLKEIEQDYGKFSWIRITADYETSKPAVLNRLFEIAETNDFQKLVQLYSSKERGLKVPSALVSMYKLNAPATIELVRSHVENFDEKFGDFSTIADEINFLKLYASKDILSALMPKLLRLLELAEKRKDVGAQALILDSFSGGSSGGGSSSSGSGSSVRPTWGQVFSGSNYESKCTSGANTALALYRRGLINGTEITFALRDLASGDCDRRGNRGILYGVVASICEEASRKSDSGVLNSCFTDVFVPLLQWRMKNQNSEHAQSAKEYLERLFKILPSQTVASLNPSCRIRIAVAPKYGKNEQLIEDGKTLYIQKLNGAVTVNECQKMQPAPIYVIDERSQ